MVLHICQLLQIRQSDAINMLVTEVSSGRMERRVISDVTLMRVTELHDQ